MDAIKTAPWLAYIFLVQNLFHLALPPAIGPTWALCIEEQYYFLWAPLVKYLRKPGCWLPCCSARWWFRHGCGTAITPAHGDTHADSSGRHCTGEPAGAGDAYAAAESAHLLWIGLGCLVAGISAAATIAGGTAFLDSALAVGFVGGVLALIASTGARNPINAALRSGPLAFYGRISYGLYMIHISVFILLRLV